MYSGSDASRDGVWTAQQMTTGAYSNNLSGSTTVIAEGGHADRDRFGWWGYQWGQPEPRSILWLLDQGMLDTHLAAFLSLAIEARRSVIVAARPHGAGKTTLLTALLDFLPPDTLPIYLRGWYERFEFLQRVSPSQAYVLCNEISAHLPIYLWGRGVRRVFDAAAAGYPIATTMHAGSAEEAFDQLASFPLEVPRAALGVVDLVVTIDVGYASNRLLRRVVRVERAQPSDGGPAIEVLASRAPLRGALDTRLGRVVAAVADWCHCADDDAAALLARREHELAGWLAHGIVDPDAIRRVIADLRDAGQHSLTSAKKNGLPQH